MSQLEMGRTVPVFPPYMLSWHRHGPWHYILGQDPFTLRFSVHQPRQMVMFGLVWSGLVYVASFELFIQQNSVVSEM
jgi:hypothetical protein